MTCQAFTGVAHHITTVSASSSSSSPSSSLSNRKQIANAGALRLRGGRRHHQQQQRVCAAAGRGDDDEDDDRRGDYNTAASASASLFRGAAVAMGAAALTMTATATPAWADIGALLGFDDDDDEVVVTTTTPSTESSPSSPSSPPSPVVVEKVAPAPAPAVLPPPPPVLEDVEVVEMSVDDVEVGRAPDIEAQKAKIAERDTLGLTELEQKAVENNQRIKQYNNAPAEFPTFVREGYDVKCITSPGFVTQDDGLVYKDFTVGVGTTPVDGQEVTFHYIAYNENGGTIDSTYRKNMPASTRLGIGGMIPGFEEGLKGMKEGGMRRVVVPPELGPPVGPATFFSSKQWEVFDIELIKIKSCDRVQTGFMTSSVVCSE